MTAKRAQKERTEAERFRAELRELAVRLALIGAATWLLLTQVFLITTVKGQDMFPALKDGDLVIAFRLQRVYAKGDVVVCKAEDAPFIGRIAAAENDNVNLDESGVLTVNGTPQSGEILYPTYAREAMAFPFHVPEGQVFLLGDNRTQARDSRDFGPIPSDQIQAKVITILRRRGL
ncbi:MAG: signal peptidase I [Oscillospiraceae bacterium]|nr:signal peptidase I [Oscillospiraceae bacterium]